MSQVSPCSDVAIDPWKYCSRKQSVFCVLCVGREEKVFMFDILAPPTVHFHLTPSFFLPRSLVQDPGPGTTTKKVAAQHSTAHHVWSYCGPKTHTGSPSLLSNHLFVVLATLLRMTREAQRKWDLATYYVLWSVILHMYHNLLVLGNMEINECNTTLVANNKVHSQNFSRYHMEGTLHGINYWTN